jgi:hypothetical protein
MVPCSVDYQQPLRKTEEEKALKAYNFKGSLEQILLILEATDLWNTRIPAIIHQTVHHTQPVLLVGTAPILSYQQK